MRFIQIVIAACCAHGLSGCSEELSYSYLMQHPSALKHEIEKCESTSGLSEHCKIVESAAKDLMPIIEEQQKDPQEFGQKILDLETACAGGKLKDQDPCEKVKVYLGVAGIGSPE